MFWQWFFVVCKTAGKIETETAKISDQQKMSVGKSNSRKTGGGGGCRDEGRGTRPEDLKWLFKQPPLPVFHIFSQPNEPEPENCSLLGGTS